MRCLVLLTLLALATPAHAEHVYESERLRISGDVDEAWIEEAAELGGELFTALERHFGRAPAEAELPLVLVIHPDRASYRKALAAKGVQSDAAHAGGWTFWKTGISHVWVQAEPFDTRRLILHELFHQFHDKVGPSTRRGQGPWWYREGLAEWFGWHRRTKEGLRFGALDAVALNDLARRAALRAKARDFDPWKVAVGKTRKDYVDALALVGGLMLAPDRDLRARFRLWEREMLTRGGGTKAFERRFRERRPALLGAVRLGWSTLGGQWLPREAGWDERDGVISVRKRVGSRLWRVRGPSRESFAQRVEIVTGTEAAATAGLTVALGGTRSVHVFVDAGGVRLERRPPRAVQPADVTRGKLPEGRKTILQVEVDAAGVSVHAQRSDRQVELFLAETGVRVDTWGLLAMDTGARFRLLPATVR